MNEIETIDRKKTIIKMQSEIIDDLFAELSQHITADELDNLPCIEKINDVAKLADSNN